MHNLARTCEPQQVCQQVGTVTRVEGRDWLIQTDEGLFRARRAVSCLLEPAVDDLVLLAVISPAGCYILSILERREDAAAHIVMDSALELSLPNGSFTVTTAHGVNITAAQEVAIASGSVSITAEEGNLLVRNLSLLGTLVSAEVDRIKVFAKSCDGVFDRIMQRVKRSYRVVEEIDSVQAEQINYTAKQNLSMHARNTLVTAEQLVKVDAEQIHLG